MTGKAPRANGAIGKADEILMREAQYWGLFLAVILLLGNVLSWRDRARFSKEAQLEYRMMGYFPGVTRSLGPQSRLILGVALALWLLSVIFRIYYLYH